MLFHLHPCRLLPALPTCCLRSTIKPVPLFICPPLPYTHLTQQTELVLLHQRPMLDHLLPALADVISAPGESGDTRFFCLRMVSEVTQLYLLDPVRCHR